MNTLIIQIVCVAQLIGIAGIIHCVVTAEVGCEGRTKHQPKRTTTMNPITNKTGCEFSAEHWFDGVYPELYGQIFVVICAVSVVLIPIVLVYGARNEWPKTRVFPLCIVSATILFIAGIVECWYAFGFGQVGIIPLWVPGAGLCFLISLSFVVIYVVWAKSLDYASVRTSQPM